MKTRTTIITLVATPIAPAPPKTPALKDFAVSLLMQAGSKVFIVEAPDEEKAVNLASFHAVAGDETRSFKVADYTCIEL